MRKYMFGFIATLFVVLAAAPASAETQENTTDIKSEQETISTPVECTFHNFTQHTVPEHSAYMVGDAIDFEITLSDPENRVERIVFSAGPVGKHGHIEEIFDTTVTWSPTTAGEWPIYFQLFDADGQEIIPTGDCNGAVTVLEYVEPAHPDHPDVVEMPEQPPAEADTCATADPSTLIPERHEDGSVSYYTPDGELCGTVIAEKVAPQPVPNNAPTRAVAAQQATAPQVAELPRTGTALTITAIGGFVLVLSGFFALYVRRFALN